MFDGAVDGMELVRLVVDALQLVLLVAIAFGAGRVVQKVEHLERRFDQIQTVLDRRLTRRADGETP